MTPPPPPEKLKLVILRKIRKVGQIPRFLPVKQNVQSDSVSSLRKILYQCMT